MAVVTIAGRQPVSCLLWRQRYPVW